MSSSAVLAQPDGRAEASRARYPRASERRAARSSVANSTSPPQLSSSTSARSLRSRTSKDRSPEKRQPGASTFAATSLNTRAEDDADDRASIGAASGALSTEDAPSAPEHIVAPIRLRLGNNDAPPSSSESEPARKKIKLVFKASGERVDGYAKADVVELPVDIVDSELPASVVEEVSADGEQQTHTMEIDDGEEAPEVGEAGDKPKRAPRKKRKWLKKGEVDPDDALAVARQRERHALIDAAIASLDAQEREILDGTHPQLVMLQDELERRFEYSTAKMKLRFEADLAELGRCRRVDREAVKFQYHQVRGDLVERMTRENIRIMSHLDSEKNHNNAGRPFTKRQYTNMTSLRDGRGSITWTLGTSELLSNHTLPTVPVIIDGVVRQRPDTSVTPRMALADDIHADIEAMGRIATPEYPNLLLKQYDKPAYTKIVESYNALAKQAREIKDESTRHAQEARTAAQKRISEAARTGKAPSTTTSASINTFPVIHKVSFGQAAPTRLPDPFAPFPVYKPVLPPLQKPISIASAAEPEPGVPAKPAQPVPSVTKAKTPSTSASSTPASSSQLAVPTTSQPHNSSDDFDDWSRRTEPTAPTQPAATGSASSAKPASAFRSAAAVAGSSSTPTSTAATKPSSTATLTTSTSQEAKPSNAFSSSTWRASPKQVAAWQATTNGFSSSAERRPSDFFLPERRAFTGAASPAMTSPALSVPTFGATSLLARSSSGKSNPQLSTTATFSAAKPMWGAPSTRTTP
ncbi:hypothetical protein Q5752_006044 [Cryptotrichosporon argae]